MTFCACMHIRPFGAAVKDLIAEIKEWVECPSKDEASDICWALGRLLGSVTHRLYVSVPGDGMTVAKVQRRMQKHGCIRSDRHLVDGHCPSL